MGERRTEKHLWRGLCVQVLKSFTTFVAHKIEDYYEEDYQSLAETCRI